ncbi:MAG: DNA polymerase III subunit delta [Pseudomonadales bacterium]|nr:DNA polymerase III subunit delta [Pseudomonadales bacterium]
MQVKPEQLLPQLQRKAMPVVWISGDETLLVQDSCDRVRKYAREQGFSEREVLDVHSSFDWNTLLASASNLSLFGDKKLIDLRLASGKLDEMAKKTLQAYVENPGPDNLLLITSGKVEKASQNTKWFKAIESQACFVQVWPVNAQQLPGWIRQRLKVAGLTADAAAVTLLAELVEGNLLAAAQEIDKLAILAERSNLDQETVLTFVSDNARFTVFNLIDAALEGAAAKALRILSHLRSEGVDPLQILSLLCRELRSLVRMKAQMDAGAHINGVMQAERVWNNRSALVSKALHNHNLKKLERILQNAGIIDQSIKGMRGSNPWDDLAVMILQLANTSLRLSA